MLKLLTNTIVKVELPLLDYIYHKYCNFDYVTLITDNGEVYDICTEPSRAPEHFRTFEAFVDNGTDMSLEEFKPVEDKYLSEYFKLINIE